MIYDVGRSCAGFQPILTGTKDADKHFQLAGDRTECNRRISPNGALTCLAQTTHDFACFMRVLFNPGHKSSSR
jgi:hypothetical protein